MLSDSTFKDRFFYIYPKSIEHMKSAYQQCSFCFMDTSDPEITFNDKGECNHCTHFFAVRAKHQFQEGKSDKELFDLIDTIKNDGLGKPYDAVLGLSGGVDSSYVAYIAKEKGLRLLAIHLDNGWNAPEATHNVTSIVEKLNIDLVTVKLNWEDFKAVQLAFLKASVPEAETPTDIAIPAVLHREAANRGIKYIISGGNMATEGILPKFWQYNAKDERYFNAILQRFSNKKNIDFPTFGYKKEMYFKLVKKMKIIYLLNYIPYDKDKAKQLLEEKLDWKYYGGKHYESKYTGFIQSYYLFEKFNIDYRRATLSTQLCNGTITKEEGTQLLKHKPYDVEKIENDITYIANKLGVSVSEFKELVNREPHWYTDYPNDEAFLQKVYNIYRTLFRKEKLANF